MLAEFAEPAKPVLKIIKTEPEQEGASSIFSR
jgi:hypothetical protein